jgi:hypothetical protein
MSASEDVKTLFRRFGGEADTYQEVVRERQAEQALGKWAMLGQVDLRHPQEVPGVQRAVKTSAVRQVAQSAQKILRSIETQAITPPRPLPQPPAPVPVAQAKALPVTAPPLTGVQDGARVPSVSVVKSVEVGVPTPPETVNAPAISEAQPVASLQIAPAAQTVATPRAPSASGSVSPLAARLKGYASSPPDMPSPDTSSEAVPSLAGLFGRLSHPSSPSPSPKTGVLRRKFNR